MAMSEIDSFIFKFKNLLITGKSATLTIKAEAGKATVNLAAEVDVPPFGFARQPARNGPARQRRRERRAADRESAERAVHEASAEETPEEGTEVAANVIAEEAPLPTTKNVSNRNAASAAETQENKALQAFIIEPLDEIENVVKATENKTKVCEAKDLANVLSIIPVKNLKFSDEFLQKAIRDKIEVQNLKVQEIFIQRSAQGTFTRSDVVIEPAPGEIIQKIDFAFENCQVVPFFGFR